MGTHDAQYIMPDINVEYVEANNTYVARLTDGSVPNLRINDNYSIMLKEGKVPADAKDFLRNGMRSARWLIEAIEQRRPTLLRVVNPVLPTQRAFFDQGPLHLKPLPMVAVAAVLRIHAGPVAGAGEVAEGGEVAVAACIKDGGSGGGGSASRLSKRRWR